jgi:hypothetical protein
MTVMLEKDLVNFLSEIEFIPFHLLSTEVTSTMQCVKCEAQVSKCSKWSSKVVKEPFGDVSNSFWANVQNESIQIPTVLL